LGPIFALLLASAYAVLKAHEERQVSTDRNSKEVSDPQDRCWDRGVRWGIGTAWRWCRHTNKDEGIRQLNWHQVLKVERVIVMVRRNLGMRSEFEKGITGLPNGLPNRFVDVRGTMHLN